MQKACEVFTKMSKTINFIDQSIDLLVSIFNIIDFAFFLIESASKKFSPPGRRQTHVYVQTPNPSVAQRKATRRRGAGQGEDIQQQAVHGSPSKVEATARCCAQLTSVDATLPGLRRAPARGALGGPACGYRPALRPATASNVARQDHDALGPGGNKFRAPSLLAPPRCGWRALAGSAMAVLSE